MYLPFGLSFKIPISNSFKSYWDRHWALSENKNFEMQLYRDWSDLFVLKLEIRTETDHNPIELEIGLIGHVLRFEYYDSRHWDDDRNQYISYEEE